MYENSLSFSFGCPTAQRICVYVCVCVCAATGNSGAETRLCTPERQLPAGVQGVSASAAKRSGFWPQRELHLIYLIYLCPKLLATLSSTCLFHSDSSLIKWPQDAGPWAWPAWPRSTQWRQQQLTKRASYETRFESRCLRCDWKWQVASESGELLPAAAARQVRVGGTIRVLASLSHIAKPLIRVRIRPNG